MFLICCFNDSLIWNCTEQNQGDIKLTHLLIIKLVHCNVYLYFVIVVGRFMILALSTIGFSAKVSGPRTYSKKYLLCTKTIYKAENSVSDRHTINVAVPSSIKLLPSPPPHILILGIFIMSKILKILFILFIDSIWTILFFCKLYYILI